MCSPDMIVIHINSCMCAHTPKKKKLNSHSNNWKRLYIIFILRWEKWFRPVIWPGSWPLINSSSGAGSTLPDWRMLLLSSVYKLLYENWEDISEYFLSFSKVKHLIGDLPEDISYLFFKKEKKTLYFYKLQ